MSCRAGEPDRSRGLSEPGKIIVRAKPRRETQPAILQAPRHAIYVVHYTGCNLNIDLAPRYITVRKTHDGRTRFWWSTVCRYRPPPPRTARANTRRTRRAQLSRSDSPSPAIMGDAWVYTERWPIADTERFISRSGAGRGRESPKLDRPVNYAGLVETAIISRGEAKKKKKKKKKERDFKSCPSHPRVGSPGLIIHREVMINL